jgi:hypothetical protein
MNTTGKIQIESSLSALAKAHQELLAHFESSSRKAGSEAKAAARETAEQVAQPTAARSRRGK